MLRIALIQLRRDRITLPIWIAATALMAYAGAAGVAVEFPTEELRAQVVSLAAATPSLLALRGIADGASLGSYVYFQVFTYLALLAGLMSTFFVVRHTRADEERGRLELIASAPVHRTAPLGATLALGLLANAVLGAAVAGGLVGGGLDVGGSLLAGVATASVGLVFVGFASVVAQLAPTSRSANGISGGLVGAAFVLRAIGDAAGTPGADGLSVTSAWPSWLSPIGWGQQVHAFTQQNLAPLALSLAVAVVASASALVIQSRRDLGSSVMREHDGRATGSPRLRSALGLAWRQQWPSIVGWALGGAFLGSLAGTLAGRIADSADLAPTLHRLLVLFVPGGTGQLIDVFVAAIVGVAGVLAAGAGVQAVIRARSEEADGRAELVLAAPVRRTSWLLGWILVATVSTIAVALATGLAAGLSFAGAPDSVDRFWSSLASGVAQLPAALTFVALTALIFVVIPRATVALGWGLLAIGFIVGQFGALMQLPDWARNLSPFAHTPSVPAQGVDWWGALVLVAASVAVVALAVALVRGRQLTS